MNRINCIIATLAMVYAGACSSAFAGTVTFYGFDQASGIGGPTPNTDTAHAAFIAALNPATKGVETFENLKVGSFNGGALSVSFPTTSITGTITSNVTDYAEVAKMNDPVSGIYTNYGTNFLKVATQGGMTFFDLKLSQAVTAIGFFASDVSDFGRSGFLSEQIVLDGGTPINIVNVSPANIQSGSASYFGLITSTPFSDIKIINPNPTNNSFLGADGLGIDNIVVGQAQAVPEPSSFALLGLGAIGLVFGAYQRRQTAV